MRFPRPVFNLALLVALSAPLARQSVAFFGFAPGEDPLLASFYEAQVYRALATDSALAPVPSHRWKPWSEPLPRSTDWRVDHYRALSAKAGAAYFVLAYPEPFRFASSRIWWKPWDLKVRTFHPVRIQVFRADADSAVYDGIVAYEDSLKSMTPWPYRPARHADPVAYDAWARRAYAELAGPTVQGIRAAVAGKPMPSAVFVAEPEKKKDKKKKK
jgi:hypothetical protein